MHLGRFHFVVSTLRSNYESAKVEAHLQALIGALNGVVGNPSSPDFAKQFKDQLTATKQALTEGETHVMRPIALSILESISAGDYYDEGLYERVRLAVFNGQYAPALAVASLNEIFEDVKSFYKHIAAIEDAFAELGVEYDALDVGEAELGLLIPKQENKSTLRDFSAELKEWHKALWPMAEVFDPTGPELSIKTVATTDWMIYLAATPFVLAGISKTMREINAILREAIQTGQLIKGLAGNGIGKDLLEKLEGERKAKVEEKLVALSDRLVEENYKGDEGRKNELKVGMSAAVKIVAGKVVAGAKIELQYIAPPEKESDDSEGDEEGMGKAVDAADGSGQLRAISAELDKDVPALEFNASDAEGEALLLELAANTAAGKDE